MAGPVEGVAMDGRYCRHRGRSVGLRFVSGTVSKSSVASADFAFKQYGRLDYRESDTSRSDDRLFAIRSVLQH